MPYDDEFDNLDNSQEELEEEGFEPESDSETDDDSGKQGNLAKALQEERQKRKQFEQQLAAEKARADQMQALFDRTSGAQYRQPSQSDLEQQNAQLFDALSTRPLDVMQAWQQQTEQSMLQRFAPAMVSQAAHIINRNPDHRTLYENPLIAEMVDGYIADGVANGRIQNTQQLQHVVNETMETIQKIRGIEAAPQDPAKKRLSSTVNKGSTSGNRKSDEEVWAEKSKLANTNRPEYMKWASSPEGKRIRSAILRGQ